MVLGSNPIIEGVPGETPPARRKDPLPMSFDFGGAQKTPSQVGSCLACCGSQFFLKTISLLNKQILKISTFLKNKNKNWCPFSQRCQDAYVVVHSSTEEGKLIHK